VGVRYCASLVEVSDSCGLFSSPGFLLLFSVSVSWWVGGWMDGFFLVF